MEFSYEKPKSTKPIYFPRNYEVKPVKGQKYWEIAAVIWAFSAVMAVAAAVIWVLMIWVGEAAAEEQVTLVCTPEHLDLGCADYKAFEAEINPVFDGVSLLDSSIVTPPLNECLAEWKKQVVAIIEADDIYNDCVSLLNYFSVLNSAGRIAEPIIPFDIYTAMRNGPTGPECPDHVVAAKDYLAIRRQHVLACRDTLNLFPTIPLATDAPVPPTPDDCFDCFDGPGVGCLWKAKAESGPGAVLLMPAKYIGQDAHIEGASVVRTAVANGGRMHWFFNGTFTEPLTIFLSGGDCVRIQDPTQRND